MSDVVVLSSDESESEKTDQKVHDKEETESKRHVEQPSGSTKKRRLEPTYLGSVKKDPKGISESNGSVSPPIENYEVAFNEFIGICLRLDSSNNMKKIVEKKLRKYYSLLVPEYRSSEQFRVFLERKGAEMQRSLSQRFIHLKEVVDELSVHRSDKIDSSASNASDRFVRKLCKAMELLHRKIKKLEEKEVDWEEDNDSTYIQLQRYRERLIKIHLKLQELEGNSASIFCRKISFSGTQFPKVNRAIEKYVNAKGEFPDFNDIYDLLKISYQKEEIQISKEKLRREAKSVFEDIGEQLQKLRKNEFWEAHRSFLEEENDPADENEELKIKLNENKKKFQESIDEIINSFVERKSKKDQFASEDSNSSEAVKKEANSGDENQTEECEEEDNDNDDDSDEDDEENENGKETMDDILGEIGEEEPEDSSDSAGTIFMNCAPVSPPTSMEEGTDSNHPSQSSSPELPTRVTSGEEEEEESEHSGEITVVEENSAVHSVPGCSKWDDNEKNQIKTRQKEINCKTVKQEPDQLQKDKPLIKVRSLQSLQNKVHQSVPEEILLD